MKYGESTFDIIYLLFAIISGIVILAKHHDTVGKLMGSAALILGFGDAFHLVPRVLNYFIDYDFTFWLGLGKLVTSITQRSRNTSFRCSVVLDGFCSCVCLCFFKK